MRLGRFIPPAPRLLIASGALLIGLLLYPVRSEITRVGIILALGGADAGLLLALRHQRNFLLAALAPQILLAVFLAIPGRNYDPAALRSAYLAALHRYEGTRYVWGGENYLGVDCSGLLRVALVDAHLIESIKTANPRLLRQAIWFWWNDASAREMSEGYRGNTVILGKPALLSEVSAAMEPGDFAVTSDGAHVLAYLGGGEWIEADPYVNRVIRFKTGGESQWWNTRVIPCRWKALADQ